MENSNKVLKRLKQKKALTKQKEKSEIEDNRGGVNFT